MHGSQERSWKSTSLSIDGWIWGVDGSDVEPVQLGSQSQKRFHTGQHQIDRWLSSCLHWSLREEYSSVLSLPFTLATISVSL